jgi:hypothetical protein
MGDEQHRSMSRVVRQVAVRDLKEPIRRFWLGGQPDFELVKMEAVWLSLDPDFECVRAAEYKP